MYLFLLLKAVYIFTKLLIIYILRDIYIFIVIYILINIYVICNKIFIVIMHNLLSTCTMISSIVKPWTNSYKSMSSFPSN